MFSRYQHLRPGHHKDKQKGSGALQVTNRTRPNASGVRQRTTLGRCLIPDKQAVFQQIADRCRKLAQEHGGHSNTSMAAAGFAFTGIGDATRCNTCDLEISGWTENMSPFAVHAQRSPSCDFVRSMAPQSTFLTTPTDKPPLNNRLSSNDENPPKRIKVEIRAADSQLLLTEAESLKRTRKRTFSHWPAHRSLTSSRMIEAGFFACNVADRVICLYCNIICQQWKADTDDPDEVHKLLSPRCPFVVAMLARRQTASIHILNEQSSDAATTDLQRWSDVVYTSAHHPAYAEVPRRQASFGAWSGENMPSVDDLVRAGFFYTATKTIVTCFYCNGSLQNWGPNDNPTIEHARWFPQCAYAKQLCGDQLYRRIQETKKAQQERNRRSPSNAQLGARNDGSYRGPLDIPDEAFLSRLVAARLDLAIAQSLLDRNYKLSIIKRCFEDQLRIKRDDFADECDVLIACIILQKQIVHIDGKKENIIVPSEAKNKLRERERAALAVAEQATRSSTRAGVANDSSATRVTSSEPLPNAMDTSASDAPIQTSKSIKAPATDAARENHTDDSSSMDPCVLCLTEQKQLACIPCGHFATCVPCGHSLRLCPICRRDIDAFVRIYT